MSEPRLVRLLLGEVADHGQLEVLALEALDQQDDPADQEDDPHQAEQQVERSRKARADHADQGPDDPEGDRLHGVEADLGPLVDQEEDQPGHPGEHIRQAGGDVLGHAAAGRLARVLAAVLLVAARLLVPAGLLVAAGLLLVAARLVPALAALGRRRGRGRGPGVPGPSALRRRRWGWRGARRVPAGGVVGARGAARRVVGRGRGGGRLLDGRLEPAGGRPRRLLPRVAWGRPLGHVVLLSSALGPPGRARRSTPTRTGGAGTPSSGRPGPRPPSSLVGGGTPAIEPPRAPTRPPGPPSARP